MQLLCTPQEQGGVVTHAHCWLSAWLHAMPADFLNKAVTIKARLEVTSRMVTTYHKLSTPERVGDQSHEAGHDLPGGYKAVAEHNVQHVCSMPPHKRPRA